MRGGGAGHHGPAVCPGLPPRPVAAKCVMCRQGIKRAAAVPQAERLPCDAPHRHTLPRKHEPDGTLTLGWVRSLRSLRFVAAWSPIEHVMPTSSTRRGPIARAAAMAWSSPKWEKCFP